jgi:hypothetical protein
MKMEMINIVRNRKIIKGRSVKERKKSRIM